MAVVVIVVIVIIKIVVLIVVVVIIVILIVVVMVVSQYLQRFTCISVATGFQSFWISVNYGKFSIVFKLICNNSSDPHLDCNIFLLSLSEKTKPESLFWDDLVFGFII